MPVGLRREGPAFLGAFASLFGLYWLFGFPIYNNAAWLDPWYYTGLWINYHFLRVAHHSAYYVTRIPWIAPGRIVFAIFSPTTAYLVIHVLVALLTTGCLYLLLRKYLAQGAALAGVLAAALDPLAYHASYRDYVVSGEIAFVIAAMYFGLAARGGMRPRLAMAGAGFFIAAAFSTHFFSALFCALLIAPYLFLFRPSRTELLRDLGAVAAGAFVLFAGCTVYSLADGGPFVYLGPALKTTADLSLGQYHRNGFSWMLAEPRLLAPIFLLVVLGALLVGAYREGERHLPPVRFGSAIWLYSALVWLVVTAWELRGGIIYENVDYTEPFVLTTVVPCLAAIIGLAARRVERRLSWTTVPLVVGAAAAATPLAVYRFNWMSLAGRRGTLASLVLMAIGLLLVAALLRRKGGVALAAAVLVAVTLATSYAVSVSKLTLSAMAYDSRMNRLDTNVFHISIDFVRWMRSSNLQTNDMVGWYDLKTMPWGNAVASMYFFGWWLQGTNMPRIDANFRHQWAIRKPGEIVLMCARPDCEGAEAALRRHGYPARAVAQHTFTSGSTRMWVRVLR